LYEDTFSIFVVNSGECLYTLGVTQSQSTKLKPTFKSNLDF
jgi:hypothetical protein